MVKASRLNAIFLKGNLAFSWGDEMVHTCYLGALYYVTWNNFEVTRFPIGQKPMGYCGCKLFLKKMAATYSNYRFIKNRPHFQWVYGRHKPNWFYAASAS